jgi:hypothetical protein
LTPVVVELLHDVLAAAGCFALWRLWRIWFGGGDRRVIRVVGLGFLLRAFLGQALFWISYLKLPIGRSMQIGDGLWFFALDGWFYMGYSHDLVRAGPAAIVLISAHYPSHVFVQILTAFVAALGGVASVALLMNCAAYLATCAIIVRLQPRVNGAVLFAVAALAFGPGTILWSLQPLKDTVFELLIAAFVFVCARWQERPRVWLAAATIALGFALSGIRWYFGVIAWAACGLFFLITALRAPRRGWALLAGAAIFAIMSQAVRVGGGVDVVGPVRRLLDPRETVASLGQPSQVTRAIAKARKGFERSSGATTIAPGPLLAPPPAPPVPRPLSPVPSPPSVASRMLSGVAIAFFPRVVGQALGLVRVGGGRGLWIFAELDTIAFDAVLVFAIVYIVRSRRRVTPLFVMVLLILIVTAGPMVYTVANFGTLFRLRQMLYFLAAILPVTLGPDSRP